MKIVLLAIGRTNEQYLIEGIAKYQKRLKHYTQFEIFEIPYVKNAKNFSNAELMKKIKKIDSTGEKNLGSFNVYLKSKNKFR